MTNIISKATAGIGSAFILTSLLATPIFAGEASNDNLSPDQILKKAAEHYAALTSYSDEGHIVSTAGGLTSTTTFNIRLARPNQYRIEWQLSNETSYGIVNTSPQAAWSSGAGDFLETGHGTEDETGPDIALDEASTYSGGASVTIPMKFFKMNWGDVLGGSGFGENRQPDEKVGAVDCYVLSRKSEGQTKTIWIGKKDFLIHQIQTVVSTEAIQATMAKITNERPPNVALAHGFTSTEVHDKIVVNKQLARSDFIPLIPHFASSNDE